MKKIILTCGSCGQRMLVPRSAIGRTGLCPACGTTVHINSDNTSTVTPTRKGVFAGATSWWRGAGKANDDAKRRFAEAVDLYYLGRFAESLAILNMLTREFPGNPDIERARVQCERALRNPGVGRRLALEDKSEQMKGAALDRETVERIVLEKLLAGESEAVQLQAADIAARLLGLYNGAHKTSHEEASPGETAPPANQAPGQSSENSSAADDTPFSISTLHNFTPRDSARTRQEITENDVTDDGDTASSDTRRS
jgi:hypothetical protein